VLIRKNGVTLLRLSRRAHAVEGLNGASKRGHVPKVFIGREVVIQKILDQRSGTAWCGWLCMGQTLRILPLCG
jgi:hypothetical protein